MNSSDTSVAYAGDTIRDLATRAGTYRMIRTTLAEYLTGLCLFDPATKNGHWDISMLNVPFQRMVIPIKKNAIKKRTLRDMLRGGTLPPTVLVHRQNERALVVILAANRSDLQSSSVRIADDCRAAHVWDCLQTVRGFLQAADSFCRAQAESALPH